METRNTAVIMCIIVGLCGFGIMINGLYNKKVVDVPETTIETQISNTTTQVSTNTTTTTKTTKKAVKTTKKAAKKKVSAMNVRASKSEMQEYAKSYIGNDKEYEAFDFIITHESGWNPNSVNKKSNATGLCQALPGSKMKSEGADWKTNYKTQVRWCVKYCQVRYGSIQKAKQFWLKHHWF